jgi:oleate hydratase
VYLNGLGLGSISAAIYLIQKADFTPSCIHIFEQKGDKELVGGSCDASEMIVNGHPAYSMQGSRMFEDKVYPCTKELWSMIPYNDHESCLQDHQKNHEECQLHTVVRLLHGNGRKDTGYQLGLDSAEKLKMAKLLAMPESMIPDGAKITDMFGAAFFTSNFWFMWRSLFAFQPWHSAVEMKRYMHLFFHEMPHMNTMSALERTRYTNFHSFILPALRFMKKQGVIFHYDRRISEVDFESDSGGKQRRIARIHLETGSGEPEPSIEVGRSDLVFLTIGIAGGPYLGLLGTVIGVMITFAVIAKSGEVEVNSIAPGIAGALLATVAGLAVAIPALFIYSYLSSRIKDVVSNMETFIDEFVTKMAEHYKE